MLNLLLVVIVISLGLQVWINRLMKMRIEALEKQLEKKEPEYEWTLYPTHPNCRCSLETLAPPSGEGFVIGVDYVSGESWGVSEDA